MNRLFLLERKLTGFIILALVKIVVLPTALIFGVDSSLIQYLKGVGRCLIWLINLLINKVFINICGSSSKKWVDQQVGDIRIMQNAKKSNEAR